MNHFSFDLSLIAVLPALALCAYVFFKDRIEKEPIGLLALLFGVGAVAYLPSTVIEHFVLGLVDKGFESSMRATAEGYMTFASSQAEITYLALCAFLGYSVIRIAVQWIALFLVTHRNKNFNYLFDGVVYSVFVSLGFAVSENIHFLLQNDVDLILPKLSASVPCQLFVGVVMGYFYTMWHMRFVANKIENKLKKVGAVQKDNIKTSAPWLVASVAIPVIISTLYSLAGAIRNDVFEMIFYTVVFSVFGLSFIVINQIASKDGSYGMYLYRIIAKGHPDLSPEKIKEALAVELEDEKEADNA